MTLPDPIDDFITRWQWSSAAERANFQQFAVELCDLLGVERPQPSVAEDRHNSYVFEKSVPLPGGTRGRIDLYKRGCFVMEAKQGSDQTPAPDLVGTRRRGTAVRGTAAWDTAMERARQQAQSYARNLPPDEIPGGRPPLLVVVDVGDSLALYSEFTRTGGSYVPFPDPNRYRIRLDDLRDADTRALLARVWTDPMSLDPTRRSARVTREIAGRLALLAKSLERDHNAETVAGFLMRCLFTMFAEDVGLLPNRSFTQLLADISHDLPSFLPMISHLWQTMRDGGYSVLLRNQIPQFNGGLFEETIALPLDESQLHWLRQAAAADWREVEPAIFGTLLERALDPVERHKLGAHYTPRAYVERLVQPTLVEPLRAEWEGVQAAALLLAGQNRRADALAEVERFQRRLASLRVLDPACGTGNFLYVALAHLKGLESEVLEMRRDLAGESSQMMLEVGAVMVTPDQFLGIEVNPRAAAIADLVLWIGYLQWHFRTRGETLPGVPILRRFHNIDCRDAVLDWRERMPLIGDDGQPVTRWDGRTTKPHPVTGEAVPDETARTPVYRYVDPTPAQWPATDFIVGNPPFIGNKQMREALGDGYTEAVRRAYRAVPDSADYVMFWWHKAADLLRRGEIARFGFITTNSLRQTFNRRVLQQHMEAAAPLSLVYAIPDHPWVDEALGADVRIAMTVAAAGEGEGLLRRVVKESEGEDGAELEFSDREGKIQADLSVGANVASAEPLKSNGGLSRQGCKLVGAHFQIEPDLYSKFVDSNPSYVNRLPQYIAGRDVTQTLTLRYVIDLFGLSEEEALAQYPELMQHVINYVLPSRMQTRRKSTREKYWIFGEARANLREALAGLSRYIVTSEVSKHRIFKFISWPDVLIDGSVIGIPLEDAYFLGILSSRIHVQWSLAAGGTLEDRPRYNNSVTFETFPFPDATEAQRARIRDLGERLDAHRKRQQAQHPSLTFTDMYNVLEKLRTGDPLSAAERTIHEGGLVSVLRQLHDDLDRAVADAYGWPADLPEEEILARLVDLNAVRAAEEKAGRVRWLRPAYQAPHEVQPTQSALLDEEAAATAKPSPGSLAWPDVLPQQAQAVRAALALFPVPASAEEVAGLFGRRSKARVQRINELLEMLVLLGQATVNGEERYAAG
ncbi:MAG: class I SAM-dependent DNA methyltransferase [Caldilineaceae bacterium]|nr:class I SAM-dependent DNA methyltransferase [Caldilineaceae bacterium]